MSHQSLSHRRQNMLTGEWVLVSPQRALRPWQGQLEEADAPSLNSYEADCYLCPGNKRFGQRFNPDYNGPFAFDNDFPALSAVAGEFPDKHPLLVSRVETGRCRVICYSEQHNLSLADMPLSSLANALAFMSEEFQALDAEENIAYVQLFENRGQMMGCSNAHPHAQLWATSALPEEPRKELVTQQAYFESHGRSLLLDYLETELAVGSRVVLQNEHAVSLLPFWAVWPYETLLMPRQPAQSLTDLSAEQRYAFASLLQQTLTAYNQLFKTEVPYSMGFHCRPSDGKPHPEWQMHVHIYPPLLRSASIRKHLVGFEMLGMPQRDLTPEAAAENIRNAIADNVSH